MKFLGVYLGVSKDIYCNPHVTVSQDVGPRASIFKNKGTRALHPTLFSLNANVVSFLKKYLNYKLVKTLVRVKRFATRPACEIASIA